MNAYALLIGLGASLGVWQVISRAPRRQQQRWGAAAWVMLAGCLIGARIGFVLLQSQIFLAQPWEVMMVWRGGLFWPGAAAGGLLTTVLLASRFKTPVGVIADRLEPLLAPLTVFAWLGCLAAGCGYGPLSPPGAWWGLAVPDETGSVQARLPLQILAALSLLALFMWIERVPLKKAPAGRLAAMAGLGMAGHLLIFSLLRADPMPMWAGVRLDAWAAVVFTALGSLSLAKRGQKSRQTQALGRAEKKG